MTKEHILEEIRRVAEANGRMALGINTFRSETGIKESDWHGKYWARWSDAVRDAGYSPNTLQIPYKKAELLEAYARLTRELGKLPVQGDLRLKARSDSNFPSATTFLARFGNKSGIVAEVLTYCRKHRGYSDVVEICECYVPTIDKSDKQPTSPKTAEGFVYLMKSGRFYKIGRSNAAGRREYELAIQLPEKPTTIHVIKTDDPIGIEGYWHKRFESKRKNGEWFELDSLDITAFKRRKFQ